LAVLLASAGCDDSFEPIAGGDRSFSVYGHLDPHADTQWIRIMPLRCTILTSPEPPGTVVTLQAMGSGQALDVRGGACVYVQVEGVGSGGVCARNFWNGGEGVSSWAGGGCQIGCRIAGPP